MGPKGAAPSQSPSGSLSSEEQRTLDRFIAVLQERLGEDLGAAWLYGSRARGEPPRPESDVDIMVVTARGEGDRRLVYELLFDAAEVEGTNPARFSVQVVDPAWVQERREIKSFFIQEVDRDKRVLAGRP